MDYQSNVYDSPQSSFAPLNLFYHLIELDKNGSSKVIEKNVPVLRDTFDRGMLTASLHKNGYDWWIIVPKSHSACYHRILLSKNGPEIKGLICDGFHWDDDDGGYALFSPDGKKYVRFNFQNGLNVMDFDRNNGTFSNAIRIHFPEDNFPIN